LSIAGASQPLISVGVAAEVEQVEFVLEQSFRLAGGIEVSPGPIIAEASGSGLRLTRDGGELFRGDLVELTPTDSSVASFLVPRVRIGIGFHWERYEPQRFSGSIRLNASRGVLNLVNTLGIEDYLTCVISSEMSATSDPQLLRAHAITSRSWLLAQLKPWKATIPVQPVSTNASGERIRWYDRENHADFDVCADDHCQRYQGLTKATTAAVREAIEDTFGQVLVYEGTVCDARYSKSCGGMSEDYRAAWQDLDIPYLSATICARSWPPGYESPLSVEGSARKWIEGTPPAYCNTREARVLAKILPDFDQETVDFFRWTRALSQEEVRDLLARKIGLDVGNVLRIEAVERGRSSRIIRLKITGDRDTVVIGKELEIRKALSTSHLLSSAFLVAAGPESKGVPDYFIIKGAGWGHGVGLCQIGAAAMAEEGINAREILRQYFLNAEIQTLYGR
jgi:peptidoglycan hydrolase-like amidase